jgi:hypothetical protein
MGKLREDIKTLHEKFEDDWGEMLDVLPDCSGRIEFEYKKHKETFYSAILSLVCKRIEGVEYPKCNTKDPLLLDCLNLGFETARQAILDVIKEE